MKTNTRSHGIKTFTISKIKFTFYLSLKLMEKWISSLVCIYFATILTVLVDPESICTPEVCHVLLKINVFA